MEAPDVVDGHLRQRRVGADAEVPVRVLVVQGLQVDALRDGGGNRAHLSHPAAPQVAHPVEVAGRETGARHDLEEQGQPLGGMVLEGGEGHHRRVGADLHAEPRAEAVEGAVQLEDGPRLGAFVEEVGGESGEARLRRGVRGGAGGPRQQPVDHRRARMPARAAGPCPTPGAAGHRREPRRRAGPGRGSRVPVHHRRHETSVGADPARPRADSPAGTMLSATRPAGVSRRASSRTWAVPASR